MEGIAVQARSMHQEGAVRWERGEVFLATPDLLAAHPASLRVLKPEELDDYFARGGRPLAFVPGTTVPAASAPEDEDDGAEDEEQDAGQRAFAAPEHDRSMQGRAGVRRRNG